MNVTGHHEMQKTNRKSIDGRYREVEQVQSTKDWARQIFTILDPVHS